MSGEDSRTRRRLTLNDDYSREAVHDLFDPNSLFTRGAGVWGISGLIEIPGRPGDFVFLVTFGTKQGDHEFDEGISTEGIIRWQSQPQQSLDDPRVQRLIGQDPDRNSVHLFLRTAERRGGEVVPYTYLGRLRYDGHDRERSRPVHFRWALLGSGRYQRLSARALRCGWKTSSLKPIAVRAIPRQRLNQSPPRNIHSWRRIRPQPPPVSSAMGSQPASFGLRAGVALLTKKLGHWDKLVSYWSWNASVGI